MRTLRLTVPIALAFTVTGCLDLAGRLAFGAAAAPTGDIVHATWMHYQPAGPVDNEYSPPGVTSPGDVYALDGQGRLVVIPAKGTKPAAP